MIHYHRHDAGRPDWADTDHDCQVRALSTARGISYEQAWNLLYLMQGERRTCELPLVKALADMDERLGVVEMMSFPAKRGRKRMNGLRFCERYPEGRFILKMAGHVAAVVDGKLFDTWNSLDKCVYRAWRIEENT